MIAILDETYSNTKYDIYFKADKDWNKYVGVADSLIHFQNGSNDLQDAINICDELNNDYAQRRSIKGERTNGHFIVCSYKPTKNAYGFTDNELIIEYDEENTYL